MTRLQEVLNITNYIKEKMEIAIQYEYENNTNEESEFLNDAFPIIEFDNIEFDNETIFVTGVWTLSAKEKDYITNNFVVEILNNDNFDINYINLGGFRNGKYPTKENAYTEIENYIFEIMEKTVERALEK